MGARFTSTYMPVDASFRWLRGNHHGHSTRSDGRDEPLVVLKAYEDAGYDYFALSEHDKLLEASELQPHTSMCVLQAVEVTSRFHQTLMYLGADHVPSAGLTPREIMEEAHASGGLFVFDHPNWLPRVDYATDELLDTMEGLRGIEIYVGVIESLPGQADATNRWDRLLSKGWRVFGHGTDDQHVPGHYFIAWNCVQWPTNAHPTPEGILDALTEGRFYASSGVTIDRVGLEDDGQSVFVESDADEVHWISLDGRVVSKTPGGSSRMGIEPILRLLEHREVGPGRLGYVRATCLGRGNASAWTQPFWVTDDQER